MYTLRVQVMMEDVLTAFVYPRITLEEAQEKLKAHSRYDIQAIRMVKV